MIKTLINYLVELTYDAHVAGSILLHFSELEGEEYGKYPKELRHKIRMPVEKGLGHKFINEEGSGVYLPLSKFDIPDVCCLTIKTHSERLEDGRMHRVTQSTQAVFEIDEVGEVRVRVLGQVVWVNGKQYFHVNDLWKSCPICLANDKQQRAFGKLKSF